MENTTTTTTDTPEPDFGHISATKHEETPAPETEPQETPEAEAAPEPEEAEEDASPTRAEIVESLLAIGGRQWRKGDMYRIYVSPEHVMEAGRVSCSNTGLRAMSTLFFDVNRRVWGRNGGMTRPHRGFAAAASEWMIEVTGRDCSDDIPTEWPIASMSPLRGMSADARMELATLPEATTEQLVWLLRGFNLDIAEAVIKRPDSRRPEIIRAALASESATVRAWAEALASTERPVEALRRMLSDPATYGSPWFLRTLLAGAETPIEVRDLAAQALKDLDD